MTRLQEHATAFLASSGGHILLTALVVGAFLLVERAITPKIEKSADEGNFKPDSTNQAKTLIRLVAVLIGLLLLALIWGIKFSSVLLFSTTMLTLLGVALFAQWSILSNVTAFFALLMHPNIKRGNFVRVLDLDNYIEGYVAELKLFNVRLITENREVIIYPNNQLLSRPIVVNPRSRWDCIGKISPSDVNSKH
jgi:small-conductance mechanosensitive channel